MPPRTICTLLLLGLAASHARSDENVLTAEEQSDGWILLFDGTTTDGWMTPGGKPLPESHVQDGSLNPHPCDYMLVHRQPWDDFVLSLDFKISPQCNSGVFVRTWPLTPRPGKDIGFNGIEIAIDDTQTAGLHDTGAIYDLVKPTANLMKRAGEWNHMVIMCDKNRIDVSLNGQNVTTMDLDQWTEPNKRPDGSDHKFDVALKDHPRKGHIGLQDHGGNCWYRNIKLRPLHATGADRSAGVITNSVDMRLVKVPAGEFFMGGQESREQLAKAFPHYEPRRIASLTDEYPAHPVRITRPIYMGQHEVTIGQFKRFIAESGSLSEAERDGTGGYGYNPKLGDFEGRNAKYSWRDAGFPQDESHPVVNVTWNDANAFCEWLSKREGKTYRLPTEAEWEYACRAGTTMRYNSGDDPKSLVESAAVYDEKSKEALPTWGKYAVNGSDGFTFTAPVGSFPPNNFGLHDMHGNVWEWTADRYGEDYYGKSPVNDPAGPDEGHLRVRRGGAWHTWPLYARSSFRNYNTPQSRYVNLGFRVVMEAKE